MSLINNDTSDYIKDTMDEYPVVKFIVYGGGLVLSIWVLGKASKMLSDAVINFKHLHNAIKH